MNLIPPVPEVTDQDPSHPYNFPDATDLTSVIELVNKLKDLILFDDSSMRSSVNAIINNLNSGNK